MQANVDQIKAIAAGLGDIPFIADRVFQESDDYPALAVTARKLLQTPAGELHLGDWTYEVYLIDRRPAAEAPAAEQGFGKVEALTQRLLEAAAGAGFEVGREVVQMEFHIGGDELLGCRLSLSASVINQYLAD